MGEKNDLRTFFINALDNFESKKGMVFDHIHYTLERYVAFQLKGEEDILWMNETCYPKLLSLFDESGSIKVRNSILMIFSEIYKIDELDAEQRGLKVLLRKKFLDPEEEQSIANHCLDILLSRADDKLKEMLRDDIRTMSKSEDERLRERGLKLLEKIIGEVSGNDNTRIFSA
ncbi:unnamed protein product [marine sediment metagenome]|uniref:Condensin complex subunit 1 C-terminal domain-containing protein n=1 Tax=marine sediment metagenome TaxID=412755 RepID=X1H1E7_9ZZZZ